ncbi:hypothetical protein N0V83_004147 [Neocucurbitaria cava]|uniref:Uncharacterized protein n=1 Tax=Neocucurbitaria cava TaxID=798079 RepID=A0A9W8YAK0_9PLEO|nr:hypothetical protein N0V83_004147 [Neocucurbitaria cava]
MPSTEDESRKQRTDDYDYEEEIAGPRRHRALSPLPEITDLGPPTAGRYANEDIYWNSIMTEAVVDPEKARIKARRDAKSQGSTETAEVKTSKKIPSHGQDLEATKEEVCSSTSKTNSIGKQQPNQSCDNKSVPETGQGKDQADKDVLVMLAYPLTYTEGLAEPQSLSREPITPETKEYDAFMDYPFENSAHIYHDNDGRRYVVLPEHNTKTTQTLPSKRSAVHEDPQYLDEKPTLPQKAISKSGLQSNSHVQKSSNGRVLTWTLALNRTLDDKTVDPAMKQAVQERVQSSNMVNGFKNDEKVLVSAQDAGFVPNFSYPITGSAFYERVDPHNRPRGHMLIGATAEDRKGEGEKAKKLTNGVTRDSSDSGYSTDSSHDTLYRALSPSDTAPDRVHSLLGSVLTPSELCLHYRIVNGASNTEIFNSAPSSGTAPISNAESSTPRQIRLIRKLHTITLGLQDRVNGLEDGLVPQMSNWLKKKDVRIDELGVECQRSQDQIANLKYVVDFGNKVIRRSWERESEVWRTLAQLQKSHRARDNALYRRITRRWRDQGLHAHQREDTISSESERQASRYAFLDDSTRSTIRTISALSNSELDALITISAQNVRVLGEDVADMVRLVEKCKQVNSGIEDIGRPREGSWREL